MPALDQLQRLIIERVLKSKDVDLLDLIHKLLISECSD